MNSSKTAMEIAIEKAAKKEGISLDEYKKRLALAGTLAGKVDEKLEELRKRMTELTPKGLLERDRHLKARAPQDGQEIVEARIGQSIIERMPNWEKSPYKAEHDQLAKYEHEIGVINPYAVEWADRQQKRHAFEMRMAYRTEREEIQADAISLTDACQGKEGGVAVFVRAELPPRKEEKEGKTLTGWVRLEVKGGKARIEKTTSRLRFLAKEEYKAWVQLLPPEFRTPKGQPFFSRTIRKALAQLYREEQEGKAWWQRREKIPEELEETPAKVE